MNELNAAIITIGDELLIGQTIDTNSAFIAQELNKIGIWVKRRVAVGDNENDIWQAIDEASKHANIIILTGGLGPTADDITKPLLCKYFSSKLIKNEQVLRHIEYLFEKVYQRKDPMPESNLKQADVPDNCIVLMNEIGTAPGMWFGPSPTNSLKVEDIAKAPSRWEGDEDAESTVEEETVGYRYADQTVYGLLKEFSLRHRSNPTQAEEILWQLLKTKQLEGYKFRRQHIIDRSIADFVCLKQKLIIEIDSLIHQLPESQISDRQRTERFNQLGFKVIRFTNEEVLNKTNKVLTNILSALEKQKEKRSSFDPSAPSAGGGQGAIVVSLPGVPNEMKGLMQKEVLPRLSKLFKTPFIIHQTLLTYGIGESMLAEKIKDWEAALPKNMKLAYLPHYGMVRLRLTTSGTDKNILEKEIEKQTSHLKKIVKEWLIIDEDLTMQQAVGKLLKERKQTVGTAESCTGGYIAHLLTMDAGASSNFKGTVVAYDNQVKKDLLMVSSHSIDFVGAVSEEVVIQMVKGALQNLKTDYAIATSGIMGPDGGSENKPIGMVWIAVGNHENIVTKEFHFRFDRVRNIEQTAIAALAMLHRFIKQQKE